MPAGPARTAIDLAPVSSFASTSSPRALLVLLLALAACHAAAAALVRPLYQVSDEISYAAGAQLSALAATDAPAMRECISPPDGAPWYFWMAGGKRGFHEIGGALLGGVCAAGAGDAAPVVVRLVLGLSLLVVGACAWHVTRLVAGGTFAPALACLIVVTQPVLAKYAAGITPDSLANAMAALSILVGVRWLVVGPSWRRLAMLLSTSLVAAALKDTCMFLVPVHAALVLVTMAARVRWQRRWFSWAALGAALMIAVVVRAMPGAGYDLTTGLARAGAAPATFLGMVTADTVSRLPGFLSSALTSLGGFGGTAAPAPGTLAAFGLVSWLVAGVGLFRNLVHRTEVLPAKLFAYFGLLMVACLLEAPVRQVLLGMAEQHQGRWLFPVAVPLACLAALGLSRVGGPRAWPLWVLGHLTILVVALTAVLHFHVADATWALDRPSLYLHGTGGMDMGVERVFGQVTRAWAATAPPVAAVLALLSCLVCGALLLRHRPVSGTLHVHHADHR